ncbi:MAG: hypothetical protein CM1200mP29_06220 [Verrucomicrobiota bacterium]|nr:MAG: hypothetical protein CM1200mP29_06220 [Verrucomicrobiota bacterium]
MRVAPASIIATLFPIANAAGCLYAGSLPPGFSPMDWTWLTVAPPGPNPVLVLTKCASASTASFQAVTICSSLK